jgi:predicted phosphohydrolase
LNSVTLIEFSQLPLIEPVQPYLALLGDIGWAAEESYRNLLLDMSTKFKKVYVIAGNHEYYQSSFESKRNIQIIS